MGWLLDTNVVSEIRKPRAERRVLEFIERQPLDELFISSVSLAELRFGIESLDDAHKRAELMEWLSGRIRPMFAGRVLEVDEEIFLRWRLMLAAGRRTGHTFSQPDLIIAAVAAHYGHTVVTRDTSHFERAGVAVLNPWLG